FRRGDLASLPQGRAPAFRVVERVAQARRPSLADFGGSRERIEDRRWQAPDLEEAGNYRRGNVEGLREILLRGKLSRSEPAEEAHAALVGANVGALTIFDVHRDYGLAIRHGPRFDQQRGVQVPGDEQPA